MPITDNEAIIQLSKDLLETDNRVRDIWIVLKKIEKKLGEKYNKELQRLSFRVWELEEWKRSHIAVDNLEHEV